MLERDLSFLTREPGIDKGFSVMWDGEKSSFFGWVRARASVPILYFYVALITEHRFLY